MRKNLTIAALGVAAMAGALLPAGAAQATPATSAAPAVSSGTDPGSAAHASLAVASAVNEVIGNAIENHQNRAGYVKSLEEGAFYAANASGGHYNVLVIRYRNNYTANLNGAIYDQKASADGYPAFRVVAFIDGTVVNRGDGGYDNWAFRGWFDRDGGTVHFRKP